MKHDETNAQGTLIYLIAFGVFMGAVGRLVSMSIVGIPEPQGLWLGYLTPELVIPVIILIAQLAGRKADNRNQNVGF